MCHGESVFLGGAEINELSPPGDELVEFVLFFVDFGERPRFDLSSEPGDDSGVNAAGFGEDAQGLGEVSDLSRIDDGEEMSGGEEFDDEQAFVSAGGVDDDQTGFGFGQVVEKFSPSFRVVGKGEWCCFGEHVGGERFLGDVNADKSGNVLRGEIPSLQMRARVAVPFAAPEAVLNLRFLFSRDPGLRCTTPSA